MGNNFYENKYQTKEGDFMKRINVSFPNELYEKVKSDAKRRAKARGLKFGSGSKSYGFSSILQDYAKECLPADNETKWDKITTEQAEVIVNSLLSLGFEKKTEGNTDIYTGNGYRASLNYTDDGIIYNINTLILWR